MNTSEKNSEQRKGNYMKFWKYRKEYWKELIAMPLFWVGLILMASFFFIQNTLVSFLGLLLLFFAKHRILGRIEERHGLNKEKQNNDE